MLANRSLLIGIGAVMVVLVLGVTMIVWPNYRRASDHDHRVEELLSKIEGLSGKSEEVERLADELEERRRVIETELKYIPESPDTVELFRRLSINVDGVTVRDHEITGGSETFVLNDDEATVRAVPLTVELEATFDSIYAVIRAAETMDRLVRITSLNIAAERDRLETGDELLTASVGMEAIYDSHVLVEDE